MPPPLLLLDVDGVLNPFAAPACPPGFVEHTLFPDEEPVRVCAGHGDWLRELASHFTLVWATAWCEEANHRLAPLLGLKPLPVIPMPPLPFPLEGKLPTVSQFAGVHPLAWIDDALTPAAHAWAVSRAVPTLLVDANPAQGLTRLDVDKCLAWAGTLP
jgi:hypothetical protein